MFSRHRLKIMIVVSLAIIALFFISGLPYGLQTWINSVLAQQYGRPPAFVPRGAGGGNPPAALINCSEPLRDSPGGSVVVKDGTVLHLTPGATWLTVGNPVADPNGGLWQAIFVGGPDYVYIPVSCIGGLQ